MIMKRLFCSALLLIFLPCGLLFKAPLDDQDLWDKFRDSVMRDKPAQPPPVVSDRRPAQPPAESPKPRPVERHLAPSTKPPLKRPGEQNNPSPPYQPVAPPYQSPKPPYNPGTTKPPVAR